MKKLCLLVVSCFLLCLTTQVWATPAPPAMSYEVNGYNIAISWTEVPGASSYTLYYAPYPGAETIASAPMGEETSISFDLWENAAYYIAVTASDAFEESSYSNVEYFVMTPSAPDAPVLNVVTDGLSVSLSWTETPDATGYKLYYASDAAPDTFNSLDLGDKTEESYYLWEGAAYYLKVTSYGASGLESEPSNTEYFVLGPPNPEWVDDDGDGYVEVDGDCDDTNASINPSAEEICGDGIDQNCDGTDTSCASNSIVGYWILNTDKTYWVQWSSELPEYESSYLEITESTFHHVLIRNGSIEEDNTVNYSLSGSVMILEGRGYATVTRSGDVLTIAYENGDIEVFDMGVVLDDPFF